MTLNIKDNEYNNLVKNILDNAYFNELNDCKHHGISRMLHSKRVSYYSYKIAKALKLDYKSTAKAGLLHDFFIDKHFASKEKHKNIFMHPKVALTNSSNNFELNDVEKDIILSHMFPLMPAFLPKYFESWIVSLVDKVVATYEFGVTFTCQYKYLNRFAIIILLVFNKI